VLLVAACLKSLIIGKFLSAGGNGEGKLPEIPFSGKSSGIPI
jgi:hypothetical protein